MSKPLTDDINAIAIGADADSAQTHAHEGKQTKIIGPFSSRCLYTINP